MMKREYQSRKDRKVWRTCMEMVALTLGKYIAGKKNEEEDKERAESTVARSLAASAAHFQNTNMRLYYNVIITQ